MFRTQKAKNEKETKNRVKGILITTINKWKKFLFSIPKVEC